MSETFTTTTIAGYAGGDAELTATTSGTSILKWPMPVSHGRKGEEQTYWVNCAMFGTRADKIAKYILKGKFYVVSGKQVVRTYSKSDGTPGFSVDMNVQEVAFGPRTDDAPASNDKPADKGFGNDDVPF